MRWSGACKRPRPSFAFATDQSIFGLFQQGIVSYEEALRWASNVDEFKLRVQGISTTSGLSRDQMPNAVGGGGTPEITRFGS